MAYADNKWLDLVNALDQALRDNLSGLITEINALYPDVPITDPLDIQKGISVELLERKPDELPVAASFIYERTPRKDRDDQWAMLDYPYIIEVYLAGEDKDILNVQAVKWGMVLCEFVRRHASRLVFGFTAENFPRCDATYVLRKRTTYKQLVTVTGILSGPES